MPRKKKPRRKKEEVSIAEFIVDLILVLFFGFLAILFLKTLEIIPDPPELFDIVLEVTMFLVGIATTAIWSFFRGLQNRIGQLEHAFEEINRSIENMQNTLSHFQDYLDLSTRIARLEARKGE